MTMQSPILNISYVITLRNISCILNEIDMSIISDCDYLLDLCPWRIRRVEDLLEFLQRPPNGLDTKEIPQDSFYAIPTNEDLRNKSDSVRKVKN